MNDDQNNFIQKNSPDGGFLQSEAWRKFQESVGRKTFHLEGENFWANIIEHQLPIVGKYFYVPRGPIISVDAEKFQNTKSQIPNKSKIQSRALGTKSKDCILKLIDLARREKTGWIRIDPANQEILSLIKNIDCKIVKASHDMQPQEIFMIDLEKSEAELLAGMKSKTRYNIRLAEKKKVSIKAVTNCDSDNEKYLAEFLRLVAVTAKRDRITAHPQNYYRRIFETLPAENLKLYVAEYENQVIAANLVSFFGRTATYLHGASDDEHRNAMAPFLLQWWQIQDAKTAGGAKYDFGGVKTKSGGKSWAGITRFKTGFAPATKPIEFPGSYDIVVRPARYYAYRLIQKVKSIL